MIENCKYIQGDTTYMWVNNKNDYLKFAIGKMYLFV